MARTKNSIAQLFWGRRLAEGRKDYVSLALAYIMKRAGEHTVWTKLLGYCFQFPNATISRCQHLDITPVKTLT